MKHALNRTFAAVNSVNGSVSVDQADASQAGVGPRRLHKARQDLWRALLCLVLMVGRGGVEPPTFRFSGAARGPVVVPGRPSCLLRQPRRDIWTRAGFVAWIMSSTSIMRLMRSLGVGLAGNSLA